MNIEVFKRNLQTRKPLSDFLKKEHYCLKEGVAYAIAKQIEKMSQLRNFFDPIDRISQEIKKKNQKEPLSPSVMNKLLPLHFELANRVAREVIKKDFYEIMSAVMNKDVLKTNEDFMVFHELLTAVIAYKNYQDKVEKKGGDR